MIQQALFIIAVRRWHVVNSNFLTATVEETFFEDYTAEGRTASDYLDEPDL